MCFLEQPPHGKKGHQTTQCPVCFFIVDVQNYLHALHVHHPVASTHFGASKRRASPPATTSAQASSKGPEGPASPRPTASLKDLAGCRCGEAWRRGSRLFEMVSVEIH